MQATACQRGVSVLWYTLAAQAVSFEPRCCQSTLLETF